MTARAAIITGASRGIGAATATLLAEQGYAVCITYKNNATKAEAIANQIKQQGGVAITVQTDLSSETEVLKLFDIADQRCGPITALVNNAAESKPTPVATLSFTELQSLFAVNFFAAALCCREAIKRMQTSGGAIVNVSSEAAKFGGTQMTAYAASKAALNTFTIGAAREVAAHNIRINAISPGVIDTDMHQQVTPERLAALKQSLPMGRMGQVQEVAHLIAWLLSPAASYISGAIIPVTGGR